MPPTTHITTSGGLISSAFIENVREAGSRQNGTEPESFALAWADPPHNPAALEARIAAAWEALLERWDALRNDLPLMDVSQLRARWLLPLFQALGFRPVYLRGDTVLDAAGRLRFPLSHRGWDAEAAPVLHTVLHAQGLDARPLAGRSFKGKSPHDMLQAFLNDSRADQWALLSNGMLLRLLRDYHHTFSKGYVQFDLESIFETRNYGDFRALYRLCHASRFLPPPSEEGAVIESFYSESIAAGIKVGEDLQGQVRQAIEALGNGFLDGGLIRHLQDDPDACAEYYREVLHVVYRLLFLLYAEQRGMLPGRDSLYAETYAVSRLRARAEGDIARDDDYTDLWEGLKVTFRLVGEGAQELGVFGYDGMLFSDGQTPLLDGDERRGSRGISNSDLLRAIRYLTLIERDGALQRISYADLDVAELGSIYESLLDYAPRLTSAPTQIGEREVPANTFVLDPGGSERKTTGSYYTHPSLVDELIKSALLPVARQRLASAGLPVIAEDEIAAGAGRLLVDYSRLDEIARLAGETALLGLKVCDPAAGSGHFLVKANNALAAELARLRSGDEYPAEDLIHAARRDVLARCIYAVDLNPLAVELCKVSLWLNASLKDQKLSFLDHHIKHGNSLVGATPELLAGGIPSEAFDARVTGNARAAASAARKRNRQELQEREHNARQGSFFQVTLYEPGGAVHQEYLRITDMAEAEPQAARERYAAYLLSDDHQRQKLEADFWTAAFFYPLQPDAAGAANGWIPTDAEFRRLQMEGAGAFPAGVLERVAALAQRYRFFHWHVEFEDVFRGEEEDGFDVVLANPPWEMINLVEKEFFAGRNQQVVDARTGAERKKLIEGLSKRAPQLHSDYVQALRDTEVLANYLQHSGRYPYTSGGRINTYAVFAGLARGIVSGAGRAGIVVPTGIATDYTYRDYFADVVEKRALVSLYDFENRRKLFSEVDSRMKFALLTLAGGGISTEARADFAFFLHSTDDLADPERRFPLSAEDLALINPNTRTVPVFRTRRDAELTRKLYRAAPVLVDEATGENAWGVSFRQGLFNMTSDSHLFHTREELAGQGFELLGNRFVRGEQTYLPLYEAKMFHQFDHRFATYETTDETRNLVEPEHTSPATVGLPRYWVSADETMGRVGDERSWLLAFRDITNATNERTGIFTAIPVCAVGNNAPVCLLSGELKAILLICLLGNSNSLPFDFVVRQKAGGTHLNFFVTKQLPVLPPDRYPPRLLAFIVPRVVELTYTAWDLLPFAHDMRDEVGQATWDCWFQDAPVHTSAPPDWATADCAAAARVAGTTPPPFVWNEERRALLRAELDAVYGHLYGLTREELAHILETFPIVRRKDEAQYGEYRTKRMVLEEYDELAEMFGG